MLRSASVGAALMLTAIAFLAVPANQVTAQTEEGQCKVADPEDAISHGFARAAHVRETGDASLGIDDELNHEEALQLGPGQDIAVNPGGHIEVPPGDGGILETQTLGVFVKANVSVGPLLGNHVSDVALANVSILDGLVEADVVRAEAETFAKEKAAYTDSDGATMGWVIVDGKKYSDFGPNTVIPLDEDRFGPRSKVILFERYDGSSFPTTDHPFYTAELSVRMIHIIITDSNQFLPGEQGLEVIVGEAYAFSEVPTPWCGPAQSVGASAYVGRFRDEQSFGDPGTLVGWLELPPTGGYMEQGIDSPDVDEGDLDISFGHAETRVFGNVTFGEMSKSWSVSKVEGLCIKVPGSEDCVVSAGMIRAESQSRAFPDEKYSWAHTRIADLVVNGQDITKDACPGIEDGQVCNPPRNYQTDVGEYKVILNMRHRDPPAEGHTGYTVRAVWIEGPEIGIHIIGRAYSEAHMEPATIES